MTFGGAFVPTFSGVFDRGAAKPDLLTGLVAYWPMNEASGNALDAHTGGKTLTQAGTVGNNTGLVYATARNFNGNAANSLSRTDSALNGGNFDYTIAAWVYLTSKTSAGFVVSKLQTATRNNWSYDLTYQSASDRFQYRFSDGNQTLIFMPANNLGSPSLNTWYLLVGWHIASTKTGYFSVNNGAAESAQYPGTHQASDKPFVVGNLDSAFPITARIGPVAFWTRALSDTERAFLYNGGNGRQYTSL